MVYTLFTLENDSALWPVRRLRGISYQIFYLGVNHFINN